MQYVDSSLENAVEFVNDRYIHSIRGKSIGQLTVMRVHKHSEPFKGGLDAFIGIELKCVMRLVVSG